jgi:hypothetical protein
VARMEVGNDERPVDRRVERDGDDHPTGGGEGTGEGS